MITTTYILLFMTALLISLALVPVLCRWALKTGTVDLPNVRKIHHHARPRLGGVAIFVSFLLTNLFFVDMGQELRGILSGALIIFIVGLIDDLYGISSTQKFFGEIAAVLTTIMVGQLYLVRLGDLFGLGPIVLPLWLAIPFTLFTVVGITNAINLIDGLDGLASGITIIALVAFGFLAYKDGNTEVLTLCVALLGAVIGFLKYNRYPAQIFMGDSGSLCLGFLLGFLAVLLTQSSTTELSPMAPVIILGLPIIDTIWVMARRTLMGKSLFASDMNHVHHLFMSLGFRHRVTVIILYGISISWALLAIVTAHDWPEYLLLTCYLLTTTMCYLGLHYLTYHYGSSTSRVFAHATAFCRIDFLSSLLFENDPPQGRK
jgi:UDP-GlcNAc:undecaprenyl-phosphate GlcNAc-1-phosphate transferase